METVPRGTLTKTMYPKFILVTQADSLEGTLRMGMCYNHKDLVIDYEKVHGGGWFLKDDEKKTITLYGCSGDYGAPKLSFLNRIEKELKCYQFFYSSDLKSTPNPIDTSTVEWF